MLRVFQQPPLLGSDSGMDPAAGERPRMERRWSGMGPARRRGRNRRSGRSEARRRRWAWDNIVIVDLWARWRAAQFDWDAELEKKAGR